MRFRQSFIEKVRDSANIVDIISQYSELKRSGGGQLKGLCPFPDHNEKTPSFSVSEDKNVYHCFGCGKGGNVFTFLETYLGLSFPEAIEYLANRQGLEPEYEENDKQSYRQSEAAYSSQKNDKKTLLKLNQLTLDYYHFLIKKLPADHPHRSYCQKRGLSEEIIDKFKIGYAPDQWQALNDVFVRRKAPLELAEKNGLLKKKNKGEGYYDLFRERLMFPILSPSSEVLGFGGRILGEGQPKYLNSPETLVFHKGKTFYGLHETAKFIRTQDQAIIVEGYMDLLALYSVGICNVVAVLGTALTPDHARLLKRYTKNVIMLMDGDSAGKRAAERSLPILLSQGLYPKVVEMPEGKDPDDFIADNGVDALKKKISEADEFYLHFLNRMIAECGHSPTGKVKLLDSIGPVLLAVEDARLRSLYFQETVDRLGVEAQWLKGALRSMKSGVASTVWARTPGQDEEVSKSPEGGQKDAKNVIESKKWPLSKALKVELVLLQSALKSARFWHIVERAEIFEKLSMSARDCYLWVSEQFRLHDGQVPEKFDNLPALLAEKVDDPSLITVGVSSDGESSQSEAGGDRESKENREMQNVHDCIRKIQERYLDARSKDSKLKLKSDWSPEQLERFMNIQKQKRSLKAGASIEKHQERQQEEQQSQPIESGDDEPTKT